MTAVDQPATRKSVPSDPARNLALELVRATEAAAINCARYMGFGDKNQVDGAAVDAMRPVLGSVRMNGIVVIGEGEKDEAPMLFNGERVGDGSGPEWDIAVDPVDGTTLTAKSLPDAVSIIGVSPRGTMFSPGPAVYMQKLVVPGHAAANVDLDAPIGDNLAKVAEATDRAVSELTVCVLDRPRHAELVAAIRAAGARIRFLLDGDVAGAIMAATPSTGVDLLVGVGGTPEGVTSPFKAWVSLDTNLLRWPRLRAVGGFEVRTKLRSRSITRASLGAVKSDLHSAVIPKMYGPGSSTR